MDREALYASVSAIARVMMTWTSRLLLLLAADSPRQADVGEEESRLSTGNRMEDGG